MKKTVIILAFFLGFFAQAQTAEKQFSQANTMYQQGKYENAAKTYLAIEKKGLVSDDLYFNLGNCYYKLNKIAPAIYYYEKALKINPDNENAINNLAFSKRMSIDIIDTVPKSFFQKFTESIVLKYSFNTWAIFAVIASFLTAILFLMYYFSFSSKLKLILFNLSIAAFFVLIVSVFFAVHNYKTLENRKYAIIFAPKIEVKNAPSYTGDNVFELHEGTKVMLLNELDNWREIKIADGKTGWVRTDTFKEI